MPKPYQIYRILRSRIFEHHARGFFSDHDSRCIGVSGRQCRHYGAVCDPQPLDSVDP